MEDPSLEWVSCKLSQRQSSEKCIGFQRPFPHLSLSVPEVTKPSLSQPTAASPIGSSPSPPVNGGNNAKRVAVPNGQPPSAARYMPREVPPRFRCQQDHKVLLKRGQPPPPSCMLLGGGAGPPPPTAPGANSNNAQVTGTLLQSDGGTAPGEESARERTSRRL